MSIAKCRLKTACMKLTFVRNIQFTRLLKVNGLLREFNFRKPNNREDSVFTVDVADDYYGNRIIFYMKKEDEHWKIVPQELPDWVQSKENELDETIRNTLAS